MFDNSIYIDALNLTSMIIFIILNIFFIYALVKKYLDNKNEGCLLLLLSSVTLTISEIFILMMYLNEYRLVQENPYAIASIIAVTCGNLINFRFLYIIFEKPKKKLYQAISIIYTLFSIIGIILYFSIANSGNIMKLLFLTSMLLQSIIFISISAQGIKLFKRMTKQPNYTIPEAEKIKHLTLWAIFAIITSVFLGISTVIPVISYGPTFGIGWIFACGSSYFAYRTYVQKLKKGSKKIENKIST